MLCVICGKEFEQKCKRQKTCGLECGESLRKKTNELYRKKMRNMPKKPKEKPIKKETLSIEKIVYISNQENMSYGQWVSKHDFIKDNKCLQKV